MKRLLLLLLAPLLSGSVQATGYFHRADALEELRMAYVSNDLAARAAYFRGYVAGVADSTHGKACCTVGNAETDKIYSVVSKYLMEHPARTDQDAGTLVMAALGASFPCKAK